MSNSGADKLFLLTTCGTSIFNNLEDRDWLTRNSNASAMESTEQRRFEELSKKAESTLKESKEVERGKLSAELNGIYECQRRWQPESIQHFLLHSDTVFGRKIAHIIANILRNEGTEPQLVTAGGLRTDSALNFRAAMSDLTKEISEWNLPSWRDRGYLIVFNLTGGFKSVNAYLQALGMLHADRCVFLFEGAKTLIEIPRLPIQLNLENTIKKYLNAFRRLESSYIVFGEEVQDAPESLFLEIDGEVVRSPWADMEWARLRENILGEALLSPLSARVRVSETVSKQFAQLEKIRKVQVNEALDEFSAHIDNGRPTLKSRTFKKLQGNPQPPSTHELYAWSDGDARRLYGHYEDDVFVFDMLGQHL